MKQIMEEKNMKILKMNSDCLTISTLLYAFHFMDVKFKR